MLRESYAKKYKDNYQLDSTENRLLKEEDDDYFININRPLSNKTIESLPDDKLNRFVKDIMINKKMINVLYSTSSNIEIKHYLKSSQALDGRKKKKSNTSKITSNNSLKLKMMKKPKQKPKPTLGQEWEKKEAYFKMSKEINKHREEKKQMQINLHKSNEKKYMVFKTQSEQERNAYFEPIKERRKNQFLKTFYTVKSKLDIFKRKDSKKDDLIITKTNSNSNYKTIEEPHYQYTKTISLPNIKLNMDDVYSRLYHNTVCVSASNLIINQRPHCKINLTKRKESSMSELERMSNESNRSNPKKPLFSIKKVNKLSDGKEFILNNTDEIFKKCFFKYSGGPSVIQMIKKHIIDNKKSNKEKREDEIDFYRITDNGNYLLHIITIENQIEMVRYFLEKGADTNIQNASGDTPLHLAIRNQNIELISLLIDYGAQMTIPNNKRETPFDLATTEIRRMFPMQSF